MSFNRTQVPRASAFFEQGKGIESVVSHPSGRVDFRVGASKMPKELQLESGRLPASPIVLLRQHSEDFLLAKSLIRTVRIAAFEAGNQKDCPPYVVVKHHKYVEGQPEVPGLDSDSIHQMYHHLVVGTPENLAKGAEKFLTDYFSPVFLGYGASLHLCH
jgi:hypothetical protein